MGKVRRGCEGGGIGYLATMVKPGPGAPRSVPVYSFLSDVHLNFYCFFFLIVASDQGKRN